MTGLSWPDALFGIVTVICGTIVVLVVVGQIYHSTKGKNRNEQH